MATADWTLEALQRMLLDGIDVYESWVVSRSPSISDWLDRFNTDRRTMPRRTMEKNEWESVILQDCKANRRILHERTSLELLLEFIYIFTGFGRKGPRATHKIVCLFQAAGLFRVVEKSTLATFSILVANFYRISRFDGWRQAVIETLILDRDVNNAFPEERWSGERHFPDVAREVCNRLHAMDPWAQPLISVSRNPNAYDFFMSLPELFDLKLLFRAEFVKRAMTWLWKQEKTKAIFLSRQSFLENNSETETKFPLESLTPRSSPTSRSRELLELFLVANAPPRVLNQMWSTDLQLPSKLVLAALLDRVPDFWLWREIRALGSTIFDFLKTALRDPEEIRLLDLKGAQFPKHYLSQAATDITALTGAPKELCRLVSEYFGAC